MRVSYLKTLVELVKHKNVTKTANALHLTQPAISKQIKALEKYYETEIIVRYSSELKLTSNGVKIYEYALNVLNMQRELISKIKSDNLDYFGTLPIYTSNIPATSYLPDVLPKFLGKYKEATADVLMRDTKEVIGLVSSGKASFGFIGKECETTSVSSVEVFSSDMVLVASNKYKINKIDENILKNAKYIIREEGSATREVLESYLEKKDVKLSTNNTAMVLESNDLIVKMLQADKYLSFLPKCEVRDDELKILDIYKDRKFYYIYNKNRYMSALERAFHEFILSEVR